ncbi:MAG: hypothetical protein ACK4K7_01325 [Allosphingosinicella sp.]|uniref:hypothetical protein n=1 Tax=Allosphingosinicella sp. TaxID=2823234 RepID=UPI003943FDEB
MAQPQAAESVTVSEGECYAMVAADEKTVPTRIAGLSVIERTGRPGPFSAPELPPGTGALMCPRSTIIPAPNDWKVLEAGFALYIVERRGEPRDPRTGVLEVSSGRVRYRLVSGELAEGEEERLLKRLNQLQEARHD